MIFTQTVVASSTYNPIICLEELRNITKALSLVDSPAQIQKDISRTQSEGNKAASACSEVGPFYAQYTSRCIFTLLARFITSYLCIMINQLLSTTPPACPFTPVTRQ